MAQVACGKGHFYDDQNHSSCPFCGVDGVELNIPPTVRSPNVAPTAPAGGVARPAAGTAPMPDNARTRAARDIGEPPSDDTEPTRAVWNKRLGGIDPVVGWLVCIEGPDKGRDFRIHTERNFIGRDPSMDIAIGGDASISRLNHTVVSYNPKKHSFSIAPGDARGLTYVNEDELLAAQALTAYDVIELGASKLLFVPFCGDRFTWPVADDTSS
ncbi:FHA domain-containing protein [uncultured Thiohalocapsa sp.]|uniref:FHA domain-containing protein n=1 Tax=uncultured Thiohalocapsa sp. TaxID=768990 RepID=UPI0025F91B58|nr:FHA domain-containing protein [uncultured Thiohalocapsa sp.]